ncbi:MAG: TonB-dependent receptor, partial [Flavobacteriaceae bacterium]
MKKFLVVLFSVFLTTIYAQKVTVLDYETGKPIKSVAIYNKQKTKSSVTNSKGIGKTSIFKHNEILYFSHVAYSTFQIKKADLKYNGFKVFLNSQSEELDEVVLSVFKKKEKTTRIAEQIALVSLKQIQKVSPQTSADLLATVPGIKVQKSQFGGGSPVLRGMESNRILLVVDGVRMNNAIYRKGHLQNSITVSPNLLDKTEVVFGPSSVIYGSDALGGVIHYYTKTPKLSDKKEIKSGFFSRYSTVNQETTTTVSAELRFKKWASFTAISHSDFGDLKMGKNRSHGFSDWGKVFDFSQNTENSYFANSTSNFNPNLQRNTGFNQTDVLQKFYVPLSSKTDLKVNIQYSTSSNVPRFDRLSEYKNGSLKFAEWHYGPQNRLLISTQFDINPEKKWLQSGIITAAYQNIKESRIQRKFGSLKRSYRKEKVNVFSINGDFTVPLAKNRNLGYGFELSYNDVDSDSYGKTLSVSGNSIIGLANDFAVQSRYPDGGSSYATSAIYVDYRQDITSKSTLNSGVRATHTLLKAKWIDETFITLPDSDFSVNNQSITATIGYVYKPNKKWQLNSVISSGFRSPNIDDIGKIREKNGLLTVPNTELGPEFAYNFEVGIQKYFNNRKFRLGLNAYYTILDQAIIRAPYFYPNGNNTITFDGEVFDSNNNEILANQNLGSAYITGFTASYLGKLNKNWNTSGSITHTKGHTFHKDWNTSGPLSSIPPLFGRFEINYSKDKFEAGANLIFNAKKDIKDYNLIEGIDNHVQTPIVD